MENFDIFYEFESEYVVYPTFNIIIEGSALSDSTLLDQFCKFGYDLNSKESNFILHIYSLQWMRPKF